MEAGSTISSAFKRHVTSFTAENYKTPPRRTDCQNLTEPWKPLQSNRATVTEFSKKSFKKFKIQTLFFFLGGPRLPMMITFTLISSEQNSCFRPFLNFFSVFLAENCAGRKFCGIPGIPGFLSPHIRAPLTHQVVHTTPPPRILFFRENFPARAENSASVRGACMRAGCAVQFRRARTAAAAVALELPRRQLLFKSFNNKMDA